MSWCVGQGEVCEARVYAHTGGVYRRLVTLASRLQILTLIGLLLFTSGPASADQPPNVLGASTILKLSVVGHIRSHCGFAAMPPSSVTMNDLLQGGSLELDFRLDCNSGFAVGISSSNGGLKRNTAGEDLHVAGFATSLDYDVGLAYQTDLGTVSGHCPASSLASSSPACAFYGAGASQGLASRNGVAVDAPGSLTLTWQPPSHARLIAGSYKDTITITVGAQL
jgi:hypothetical protein